MRNIDVAVLGSTGLVGQELVDILEAHPNVGDIQQPTRDALADFEGSSTIFSALPHGESARELVRFRDLGSRVIDLSGDLRFPTVDQYETWYVRPHPAPELLPTPYGLPERNRDELAGRMLASIPGCYPTATLLGLLPLLDRGFVQDEPTIIVDADSGVSGMGKKPTESTHFMNISGNAFPYNTGRRHRHVGEIEQFLGGRKIFFSPTVIPIERGMLVKATVQLPMG